jgi:hypothetical protein
MLACKLESAPFYLDALLQIQITGIRVLFPFSVRFAFSSRRNYNVVPFLLKPSSRVPYGMVRSIKVLQKS